MKQQRDSDKSKFVFIFLVVFFSPLSRCCKTILKEWFNLHGIRLQAEIQPDGKYRPVQALLVPVPPVAPSFLWSSQGNTCSISLSRGQEEALPDTNTLPFI